jgi:hypothetical protein
MGRLGQLRIVDPVLTQIARGYTNPELIADALFPVVGNLAKESGKYPQFGKEAFKIYATERALRARSNRINPEGITVLDFVMDEHDLEYPIDYREDQEAVFPLQAHATNTVTRAIQLRREKMAADLAQNPANYGANTIALSGTSCFTDYVNSDPIGVIETGKEAIRSQTAQYPNTMVMGASTFMALKNHTKLIDRIKYSMKGVVTLDLMKELFDVPNIVVGRAVYATDAGAFTDIWGDNVILAYVPTAQPNMERDMYEPSYGYTFRKQGEPSVDRYVESGGKLEVVRSTDIFTVKLPGAEAGYLISNTNA